MELASPDSALEPAASFRLHRALQRVSLTLSEVLDGQQFGFGDFMGVDARDADADLMDGPHDPHGFSLGFSEDRLENLDDEIHRRVIVVQQ